MSDPKQMTDAEAQSSLAISSVMMRPLRTVWDKLLLGLVSLAGLMALAAGVINPPAADVWWVPYAASALLLAIALFMSFDFRKATSPAAWILASSADTFLIHLRDYTRQHFSADDKTVIALQRGHIKSLEPRIGTVLVEQTNQKKEVNFVMTPFVQLIVHLSTPISHEIAASIQAEETRCNGIVVQGDKRFQQRNAVWTEGNLYTLVVNIRPRSTPKLMAFLDALGSAYTIDPKSALPFGKDPFAVLGYRFSIRASDFTSHFTK